MSHIDTKFHQNFINNKTEHCEAAGSSSRIGPFDIPRYELITSLVKQTQKNKLYFCVNIGSSDLASRFFFLTLIPIISWQANQGKDSAFMVIFLG